MKICSLWNKPLSRDKVTEKAAGIIQSVCDEGNGKIY